MSFASRYLSELESNKGLIGGAKSAAKGTMKDIGKKFSKEEIVRAAFGGDDILSAFIRGKLDVKKKARKEKDPTKVIRDIEDPSADGKEGGGQQEMSVFFKILARNSMSFPGMARDMNVLRQNLQKLVNLKGGKASTGADAFFLKQGEREAALEAQREKEGAKEVTAEGDSTEKPKSLLDSIMGMFNSNFMKGIKSIFNLAALKKVIMKVFLPIAIIGTIFSGVTAGFKKYQETGSFSDAIVSGLGGMLSFVSFGLFGEETIKTLFDNLGNFFKPITDTISSVFNGIKNFVKKMFGGVVDVEDSSTEVAKNTEPQMPDPAKFATDAAKASGASDEKSSDVGGLFAAVQSGDTQSLFTKAQEFSQKYPETPASKTSPVPMTSEGTPLEIPEPPTPATPAAPAQLAPTPSSEMSNDDKIKQLESYIERNKRRFATREANAKRHITSFKKRYPDQPEKVKEIEDDYKKTLSVERKEMLDNNVEFQKQIDTLKNSGSGSVSATPSSPTSATPSSSSAPAAPAPAAPSTPTMTAAASSEAPGPISADPPVSGSSLSDASTQIAEAQRMESDAEQGSVVNAPTTNNSSGQMGQTPKVSASVYNEDLVELLIAS